MKRFSVVGTFREPVGQFVVVDFADGAFVVCATATGAKGNSLEFALAFMAARVCQTVVHIAFSPTDFIASVRFAVLLIQALCVTASKQWVFQASLIGPVQPSAKLVLQKRLMVWLSIGLLPLTFLWSVTYAAAGAPISAAIPGLYTVIARSRHSVSGPDGPDDRYCR